MKAEHSIEKKNEIIKFNTDKGKTLSLLSSPFSLPRKILKSFFQWPEEYSYFEKDPEKSVFDFFNHRQEIGLQSELIQKGLFKAEEILIEKYFQPEKNILVIGCATGREAIALAKKRLNVTGIDISSEMIKKGKESAQKENLNIDFEIGNVKNLKFGNETFDYAIMFNTYEHIYPKENRLKALKEIKRVLKEKGILIIWAPHKISYIVMLLFKILRLFPKIFYPIFYKFPLAPYPRLYKYKYRYRPTRYNNCIYLPKLSEKISRRYLIKEELAEFSFYIKRLIYSFVSFFVNWERRLKRLTLGEKYKGLEPGGFWVGWRERKVFFHLFSVREVLKDISYAGLNILEYRSDEEIEEETTRLSRRWTSRIFFYVVKK